MTSTDNVLSRVEQAWLRFEEDSPSQLYLSSGLRSEPKDRLPDGVAELLAEVADALVDTSPFETGLSASYWRLIEESVPAVAASIRASGPSGCYSDARRAIGVLHGGFKDAARRKSPPKGRIARGLNRVRRTPAGEVASQLVPDERLLFAWRTEDAVIVVVTEERVVLASSSRGHNDPHIEWAKRHSEIDAVEISEPFWRVIRSRGQEGGGRILLRSGDNTAELQFSPSDKSEAEVLYGLWRRQQARHAER